MIYFDEMFQLTDEGIVHISQLCGQLYQKNVNAKRQYAVDKTVLQIEEVLRHLQVAYGTETECKFVYYKTFKSSYFEFRVNGDEKNPIQVDDEELLYSKSILSMYGSEPAYYYSRHLRKNYITVEAEQKPQKNKMMMNILLAVVIALLTRTLIGIIAPDSLSFIKDDIVNLIFTKMTTIISEVATFLVFFSVITGITGVGNSATLGKMGKKLVSSSGFTYLFAAVSSSVLACLLYPVSTVKNSGENVFSQVLQLVLDIIPDNLVDCFLTDNDLQVIVLAVFLGAVLLMMGKKSEKVNDAMVQISDVFNQMMAVICKLLPLIVYFGILNLLLEEQDGLTEVYKVVIIFVVGSLAVVGFVLIRVRLVTGISGLKLFKMQWPTTLINLATSSQVSALQENIKCCKEKFGIDTNLVDFSIPLCLVAYMPCGATFLGATVYGLGDLSNIPIDGSFIFKIAFLAVVIAIAAPPIPGSAFAVMPIMMAGCGVPDTYYSLAIVLGTVLGYFTPMLNGYCMQLELLIVSTKLNMIDKSKLGIKK